MSREAKGQEAGKPFADFAPTFEIITSDRIKRLTDYWRGRRMGRPVPLRADIDPVDIPDLLPNIVMVEIEKPFRIRYRLVGTKVAEFNRLDFTGCYLDDLRWDRSGRYSRAYRHVVDKCEPVFGLDAWPLAGEMTGRSEIIILPLSSDGTRVDRCLSMEDFKFAQHEMVNSQADF